VIPLPTPLTPDAVMAQIAAALPADCRQDVIVIGSLAAGYHFFAGDGERSIRTKDVDCMFSPHARAVAAAVEVTERLLAAAWQPRTEGEWGKPGDGDTPDDRLPMIRLKPPGAEGGGGATWFLELLGAPEQGSGQPKAFHRVQTSIGHFAICNFNFLTLAEWKPILTQHGLHIARPEMMALANLLHHPAIGPELISGTTEKRSNKDLGRVLALAWLTAERDRREGTDELDAWADRMADALRDRLPGRARNLALGAGTGLRELMASDGDRDEALAICNRGLLASMEAGRDAFAAIGRRVIQQVIEPLSDAAQGWPE
jgi:hypothetical protein